MALNNTPRSNTTTDAVRNAYADQVEARPSRFDDPAGYERWALYADNWGRSAIFTEWAKIHPDFKTTIDGKRHVLDNIKGRTVLAPWQGPAVKEQWT